MHASLLFATSFCMLFCFVLLTKRVCILFFFSFSFFCLQCMFASFSYLHIVSVSFSFAVHLLVVEFTLGFRPGCLHAVFFLFGFSAGFLTLVFVYDATSRVVAVSLFCKESDYCMCRIMKISPHSLGQHKTFHAK